MTNLLELTKQALARAEAKNPNSPGAKMLREQLEESQKGQPQEIRVFSSPLKVKGK